MDDGSYFYSFLNAFENYSITRVWMFILVCSTKYGDKHETATGNHPSQLLWAAIVWKCTAAASAKKKNHGGHHWVFQRQWHCVWRRSGVCPKHINSLKTNRNSGWTVLQGRKQHPLIWSVTFSSFWQSHLQQGLKASESFFFKRNEWHILIGSNEKKSFHRACNFLSWS